MLVVFPPPRETGLEGWNGVDARLRRIGTCSCSSERESVSASLAVVESTQRPWTEVQVESVVKSIRAAFRQPTHENHCASEPIRETLDQY